MAGDPFRPFKSGDSFPQQVAYWNAINAIIKKDKGNKVNTTWTPEKFFWGRSVLMCVNSTGGDLVVGDVVALDSAQFASTDLGFDDRRGPLITAITTAVPTHDQKFGIAVEAIPDDGLGMIAVSGLAITTINISDANHDYANVVTGSTFMSSKPRGDVRIVWKEAATGSGIWCIVRFRAAEEILWAQVTAGTWTDNRPGGLCTLEGDLVDNAAGDNRSPVITVDAKIRMPDGKDPLYFEDDIFPYILDAGSADPYVLEPWFDEPINTVKTWPNTTIPKGWALADGTGGTQNLRGRFIVGVADGGGLTGAEETAGIGTAGDYPGFGQTGGDFEHSHPMGAGNETAAAGAASASDPTGDTDARPPYFAMVFIERMT